VIDLLLQLGRMENNWGARAVARSVRRKQSPGYITKKRRRGGLSQPDGYSGTTKARAEWGGKG